MGESTKEFLEVGLNERVVQQQTQREFEDMHIIEDDTIVAVKAADGEIQEQVSKSLNTVNRARPMKPGALNGTSLWSIPWAELHSCTERYELGLVTVLG